MDTESGHLLIMDGTAMAFRAYYGVGSIRSPEGFEVGAIFGMAQLMQDLMARHRPGHAVVVFDTSRDTFRRELDPRYKANRKPPPEELVPQLELAQELASVLGFPVFHKEGYEADDLMATFARMAREEGMVCKLISIDKDLCQLVRDADPATVLYDPYRVIYYDEVGVLHRLGVPPNFAIDYQALVGDSTDNIPGCPGVGPKTAVALIKEFGHIENIYDHLDEVQHLSIRGARTLAGKLSKGRDETFLSRKLVTLEQEVPLELPDPLPSTTHWEGPQDDAQAFFEMVGMYYPRGHWDWLAERQSPQP